MQGSKRWWLLAGGLFIAAGLIWWIVRVTLLEPGDRSDASGYGQFVLAAIGLVIVVFGPIKKAFSSTRTVELDETVDLLAKTVHLQWQKEAINRRLLGAGSIPLRWRSSPQPVAGPPIVATSAKGGREVFTPLPGLSRITATDLRSGSRRDLHAVYGGLASGRLVVSGQAGSGKSAVAILLLLDALHFRHEAPNDEARRRIPVPVMFTMDGWNPTQTPLHDWLVSKIREIPQFRSRSGAAIARDLLNTGRIAVFLDGFDEMHENMRPIALRALSNQLTFRLVLFSRTQEIVDATNHGPLTGSAGLELRPVSRRAVSGYLEGQLASPHSKAWGDVLNELSKNPKSPIATALRTPLNITLLRDVYGPKSPVNELLNKDRFPTVKEIEEFLLDQVVTVAYTAQPGQREPAYSRETAQQTLTYIAYVMSQTHTRDLAWWHLPEWMSPASRYLAIGALFGGICGVIFGFAVSPSVGLTAGLAFGTAGANLAANPKAHPVRIRNIWRHRGDRRIIRDISITLCGIAVGTAIGFALDMHVLTAITIGLTTGLALGIPILLGRENVNDPISDGPIETWRKDVTASLAIGLAGPLAGTAVFLILSNTEVPDSSNIPLGTAGLTFALAIEAGLMFGAAWRSLIAMAQLKINHRTPLSLMKFLEDAKDRQILRTVGPMYQFRHASLQDRLAQRYGRQ